MKSKKILGLLLLVAVLMTVALTLASCGKKIGADDIALPKQTTANLDFNYYETDNLDRKTFGDFDGSKYFLDGSDAEKFPEEDLSANLRYLVAGKKNDERIIIFYCKNEKAASDIYARLEEIKDGNSDYKKYVLDTATYVDKEYGLTIKIVCFATQNALDATVERPWTSQVKHTFLDDNNYQYMLKGFGNTILITLCALLIGVVLGVLIAVAKYYAEGNPRLRWLNLLCDIYTTVIRGIPITVLLLIFFFIILVSADGVLVAIIAFGINSGAYMAELVRSGINAVDSGQMEAARSLGMSKWQAMRTIIFPQAIKNVLPAIGNECIALLKETSVAGYVAVIDLTRGANLIRNLTYDPFNPLILSALIYLTLVVLMTWLLGRLERRLAKSERRTRK